MQWVVRYTLAMIVLTVMAVSCKHGKCESGPTSTAGGHSHNAGENCMRCHLPDGEGEICWTVAGTIFDSGGQQPVGGKEVRLFTRPLGGGEMRLAIQSDGSGNIHTSENIGFDRGLFPAIIQGGDTAFMTEPIHDGACNRCHGQSTGRLMVP